MTGINVQQEGRHAALHLQNPTKCLWQCTRVNLSPRLNFSELKTSLSARQTFSRCLIVYRVNENRVQHCSVCISIIRLQTGFRSLKATLSNLTRGLATIIVSC